MRYSWTLQISDWNRKLRFIKSSCVCSSNPYKDRWRQSGSISMIVANKDRIHQKAWNKLKFFPWVFRQIIFLECILASCCSVMWLCGSSYIKMTDLLICITKMLYSIIIMGKEPYIVASLFMKMKSLWLKDIWQNFMSHNILNTILTLNSLTVQETFSWWIKFNIYECKKYFLGSSTFKHVYINLLVTCITFN